MTSTSPRASVAVLALLGAATAAGCARSRVVPYTAAPGAVAVYRSDEAPQAPPTATRRAAVVASSRPAPAAAPTTSLPSVVSPGPTIAATPAPIRMPVASGSACGVPSAPRRIVNATCPVMLGNPVDPGVTSSWNGRTVAFSDVQARSLWEASPSRYAGNLPGFASGSAGDASAPTSARVVPGPRAASPSAAAFQAVLPPLPTARRVMIAPPVAIVGSPDGEEDAPALEIHDDEECPGGNCRLPR